MRIGVIQASSQKDKNMLLYSSVKKAVADLGHEVINFGVFSDDKASYSYIETAIDISLLLCSGAVDFIVTGCSSGQGMMLACNSLPGVLCGYAPTPQDAYLFGRINDGNAVSLPLGLNFGWSGEINLQCTLDKLFDGAFGSGYPAKDAERKKYDTQILKQINESVKNGWTEVIDKIDQAAIHKALGYTEVFDYIMQNSVNEDLKSLLREKQSFFNMEN